MNSKDKPNSVELVFTQIAWVVKDLEKARTFFVEMFGHDRISPVSPMRLKDFDATYYGEPSEAETLVSLGYTGGIFIELIQSVAGKSIFKDYIDHNPAGGIQHIAYSTPMANLDKVISDFENKGYPIVSSFDTPIAKIVFFDTREEIGVFTEIMGITEEGVMAVEQMKASMA